MKTKTRYAYLLLGVVSMLFAGIIYGWSILKAPLAAEFGWNASQLTMNFTVMMIFFCLGGFVGAKLSGKFGTKCAILLAAVFAAAGFLLASRIGGTQILFLYLTYGVLAGLGIGIAYNAVIGTVNAWFPDKKGLCSGALMMGFGASSLILGNLAEKAIARFGWRTSYALLGLCLGGVLLVCALLLRRPTEKDELPTPKKSGTSESACDCTTAQMLRKPSFWVVFFAIGLLAGVGSCVISFAKDLALSVGAAAGLATTLVGVLSVCNGLGRILIGTLFDLAGRKATMRTTGALAILASAVCLLSVCFGSLGLCIVGLCLVGLSYGCCPTCSSTITSAFYGSAHFPTNFSVMNINLILSALISSLCGTLSEISGAYILPFAVLLGLSVLASGMLLLVKKP